MPLAAHLRNVAKSMARSMPGGELRARSLYHRRPITHGVRLLCYAKQKATFEWYHELGADAGEVEVETLYTSMNVGTERAKFYRLPNTFAEFPYTPSSPGVGRVTRTGRNVANLAVGDLVVGLFKNASLQRLTARGLLKVDDVPLEDAAMVRLAIVAIQGLRMGRVRPGQRILVMGQGVIGRLATLLARAEGVDEVFCLTRTSEKLRTLGESRGIALSDTTAAEQVAELRADVVVDATGDPQAIHTAIEAANLNARIVLLGSSRGVTQAFDMNGAVMEKCLTIVGAHRQNLSSMPQELGGDYEKEVDHIIDLIHSGKLKLADVVTHRIPCEELADSYGPNLLDSRELCGVIVDWTNSQQLLRTPPDNLDLTARNVTPPATKALRIGLIGCGGIGVVNAAAIELSESTELAVCMDTNPSLANELGSRHSVPGTSDLDAVLRDATVDAVFIATPHHLHAPLAKRAADAGKHLIVEKPLAISMSETREMIEHARRGGVLLRTFLSRKFQLPYLVARRLIEHDAVGQLIGVAISSYVDQSQAYWTGGRRGRSQSDWRARPEQSGGGVLIMNLVHDLDAFHYVSGFSIDSVFCNHGSLYHPVDVEDTIGMTFQCENGAIGTMSAGNAVKGGGEGCLRIWGENGQLVIQKQTVWFYSLRPIMQYEANRGHTIRCQSRDGDDARVRCLDEFADDVGQSKETPYDEAGCRALAVVMAAYNSAALKHPVQVSEISQHKEHREPAAPRRGFAHADKR